MAKLTKEAVRALGDYTSDPETAAAEAICHELAALREVLTPNRVHMTDPMSAKLRAVSRGAAYTLEQIEHAGNAAHRFDEWVREFQIKVATEARDAERAAAVAWLKKTAERYDCQGDRGLDCECCVRVNVMLELERGEHRKDDE